MSLKANLLNDISGKSPFPNYKGRLSNTFLKLQIPFQTKLST